jgi:hypothetical protein
MNPIVPHCSSAYSGRIVGNDRTSARDVQQSRLTYVDTRLSIRILGLAFLCSWPLAVQTAPAAVVQVRLWITNRRQGRTDAEGRLPRSLPGRESPELRPQKVAFIPPWRVVLLRDFITQQEIRRCGL